jgi:hypothetical protein
MAENQPPAGGQSSAPEFDESKLPKFSEIDPQNATPEQVAELVKAGQTLLGQTKHYRGKAIDPETGRPFAELLEEAKKPKPSTPTPPANNPGAGDDDLRTSVKRLETAEEKRQFGHANSLTPEETDNLFAFAKGMDLKPTEALAHPFFKTGLAAFRQEHNQNDATPGPSRRAPTVEGKHFGEMTREERSKNFPAIVSAASKAKK